MNTNQKRSNKFSRPAASFPLHRAVGLALFVWLSCQPGIVCAQESALPKKDPQPAAADPIPGERADEFYEQYRSLVEQRKRNIREIDRLYASMPIGVVQAQAEQRQKISLLVLRNREIEEEMVQTAVRALKSKQPTQPVLARLLMNRIDRHLDGKNPQVPFDPTQALELLQMLVDSNSNQPDLTSYLYYANLLCNRFDKAREILDKATSEGFKVPPTTMPQLEAYEAKWKRELEAQSVEMANDDLPRVLIETDAGNIEVELFENEAPNTVYHFVSLVENGFYDGLIFHLVEPTQFCQSGCPRGDGTGEANYRILSESGQPNARSHFAGSLSMVQNGEDTCSSQFLIARQPLSNLDGKNTVFGRVVGGMPVVYRLSSAQPGDRSSPSPPSRILKATVLRKREHPYVPRKITDNGQDPSTEPGGSGSR